MYYIRLLVREEYSEQQTVALEQTFNGELSEDAIEAFLLAKEAVESLNISRICIVIIGKND